MQPTLLALLSRLYDALLCLYPRAFRSEFAEEMRESFALAMKEAGRNSRLAFGQVCLHELCDMPLSIWRAYRFVYFARDSQEQTAGALGLQENNPLAQSWKELALALTVFLLPAVIVAFNQQPQTPASPGLPAAILFLLVMTAIGWLGGFPLWSRLYVGIVLVIASYLYLFLSVANLISPALISNYSHGPWDRSTYLVLEVVSTGMMWLVLFCLTLFLVALLAVFNRFELLLVKIRQDWTLLSYILYGESLFALILFESYGDEPGYAIACLICMALGIWFYQRGEVRWERLLALLICLTLAAGIAVLEKSRFTIPGEWVLSDSLRSVDAMRILLSWVGMVSALLLPGLLSRLRLNHKQYPGQKPPLQPPQRPPSNPDPLPQG